MDTEQNELKTISEAMGRFNKREKTKTRVTYILYVFLIAYTLSVAYMWMSTAGMFESTFKKNSPHVAEVKLKGVISDGGGISADKTLKVLSEAFEEENAKAIILRLNSPGGSPVQSDRIYNTILRLKEEHNKKVYVVIDDICASGCYYIASSADAIYANKSSIIGSIGVVMSGFGAVDAMKKIGIERRVYTAGEHKNFMDTFSTKDPAAISHIKKHILEKSHTNFINAIKATRGNKIDKEKDLFNGLVWLADDAKNYGLIDGIGDTHYVANEIVGNDNIVNYRVKKSLVNSLIGATIKEVSTTIKQEIFSDYLLN